MNLIIFTRPLSSFYICVCVSDSVYYVAVGLSTDAKGSVLNCNQVARDSKATHKRNWIFVISQTVYWQHFKSEARALADVIINVASKPFI